MLTSDPMCNSMDFDGSGDFSEYFPIVFFFYLNIRISFSVNGFIAKTEYCLGSRFLNKNICSL